MTSRKTPYRDSVFINCPFDDEYEPTVLLAGRMPARAGRMPALPRKIEGKRSRSLTKRH